MSEPPSEFPDHIGRYRVLEVIGQGGMGTVYKAEDPETGQTVAIKILAPQLATDSTFIRRLRREADLLKQLDHPNIVRILDAGEQDGRPFLVLEYVDGTQLSDLIRRLGRVPWAQAVRWAIQICDALEHAHQLGIVHRDIKPGNVMITVDGSVKLTDFGIALPQGATTLTTAGSILGTVEYMSPEQAEGKRVDARSDLYSLGVLLYHMVTGRPPFTGKSYVEVLKRVRFDQPERIHRIVSDVPVWLEDLILQLLEKQREKRPASAAEVRRRLQAILEKARYRETTRLEYSLGADLDDTDLSEAPTQAVGHPVESRDRPGPTTLARRFKLEQTDVGQPLERTRRLVARVLAAIALLGGVSATVYYWSYRRDPERRWASIQEELTAPHRDPLILVNELRTYLEEFPTGPHSDEATEALAELELQLQRRQLLRSSLLRTLRPTGTPPDPAERQYVHALLSIWVHSPFQGLQELEKALDLATADESADPTLIEIIQRDYLALALEIAESLRAANQEDQAAEIARKAIARIGAFENPSLRPLLKRLRTFADTASTTDAGPAPSNGE